MRTYPFYFDLKKFSNYLFVYNLIRVSKMAGYHFSIKSGEKGTAADHAAYISREGAFDKPEKKQDLVDKGYGNLPEWSEVNSDLLPINRTSYFSKKSINLENDGHANQANTAKSRSLAFEAGRSRHACQGNRAQARL